MQEPDSFGDSKLYPGGNYTQDEVEFIKAIEKYMKDNKRRYPTFTEVLAVAVSLGYRRVAPTEELPRYYTGRRLNKEDREKRNQHGE